MNKIVLITFAFLYIIQFSSCNSNTNNCSIKNDIYNQLLLDMDEEFYTQENIKYFTELIEIGEQNSFYSDDFIALVNKVQSLYLSAITDDIFDSIWSKGPSIYYMNNKEYNVTELRVKQNKDYLQLLDECSSREKGLKEYKNYLIEFGTIPTNIEASKMIYKIRKSDCKNRLIIYIHFITWLSHYPKI